MKGSAAVERAGPGDREAILKVMETWNMHHVPSPEMPELDLSCFFVARDGGAIVGAAGYRIVGPARGETTLHAVLPEHKGRGIGRALQDARLEAMRRAGVETVVTNADRPESIDWYRTRYGYRVVGTVEKLCPFGDPTVPRWTTLELDLGAYGRRRAHADPDADADDEARARDYVARNEPPPLAPYAPLLVTACLHGMIPTKDRTGFVPVTPDEIVADGVRVLDAGARIVHVHARGEDGRPTWKASVFERIVLGIRRERPDLLVCVTTSGRSWGDFERRSVVLHLDGAAKPDLASLTLGSVNFPTGPSLNAPDMVQRLAETMRAKGIRPELEVFDLGMIGFAKYLERKGAIGGRKYVYLLLGNLGSVPATIGNLAALVDALPASSTWAAAGIGVFQLPMNAAAIVAGGGVRVGIEDSIHYDAARTRLATNEELVARVVRIAAELGRRVATPAEARRLAGVP